MMFPHVLHLSTRSSDVVCFGNLIISYFLMSIYDFISSDTGKFRVFLYLSDAQSGHDSAYPLFTFINLVLFTWQNLHFGISEISCNMQYMRSSNLKSRLLVIVLGSLKMSAVHEIIF